MSNHDLLEWYKYLKIPIKEVLSRDHTVKFLMTIDKHYLFIILSHLI